MIGMSNHLLSKVFSWWFHTIWKNISQNGFIFPKDLGANTQKIFNTPPPSYPLVNCHVNGKWPFWGCIPYLKIDFHCHVSLPEGRFPYLSKENDWIHRVPNEPFISTDQLLTLPNSTGLLQLHHVTQFEGVASALLNLIESNHICI